MPWSLVVCFETAEGQFFLKWNAGPFACEARLIRFLRQRVSFHVPEVLSLNENLSCFLMRDAGTPLRLTLKEKFQLPLFSEALKTYGRIQLACLSHIEAIKKLGVNDWRLEKIPFLFEELVSQDKLLRSDGMTPDELISLSEQKGRVSDLCGKLLDCDIPESLEHGDFHDNNVLVQGDSLIINDWGDVSLTHPYFSCVSHLESAGRNHNLRKESFFYRRAQEAYLDIWKDFGTFEDHEKAMALSEQLRDLVFALSFSRVKSCPEIERYPEFDGIVAGSLRNLLKKLRRR